MTYLNNKGSALVTALLIITLILIFSSVLVFTAFNNVRQTELSEQQIQATNLAEMGIMYFEEYVAAQVQAAENTVKIFLKANPLATGQQLSNLFCSQFQLSNLNNIPISADPTFKVSVINVAVNKSNCNQISVSFVSEGSYNNYSEKIQGRFTVKNNSTFTEGARNTEFPSVPAHYSIKCTTDETCDGKSNAVTSGSLHFDKKSTVIVNGLYVNGNLNMEDNHIDLISTSGNLYVNGTTNIGNQSTIIVQKGNAYFREITGASNAEIHINGDAYIYGDVSRFKTSSGNQLFVNITGTVYVAATSDLPYNYYAYCDRSRARGICANQYKFISDAPPTNTGNSGTGDLSWTLDRPTIQIEYQ